MKELTISLVIPAHNEEKYIGACLDHAIKNSGGKFFEIIVVDNASTDKTAEIVSKYRGIRLVYEAKKGTNSARQRGLDEANGDFIAYIDADTRLGEGWIELATRFFSKRPEAVSLSGPYKYYDASRSMQAALAVLWWLSAPLFYRLTGYMILGGNFIAKRSALVDMGGLDTSITFYGDDTDIARRLSAFGAVVFRMDFFIHSSCRRFLAQGFFRTNILYALNYFWEAVFHRPFTT